MDILALTETRVKDDEPSMEIPGYTIVTRHNSSSTRAGGVAIYESIKPYLKRCTHFQLDDTNAPYGDVCCVRVEFKNAQGLNDKLHLILMYGRPNITEDELFCLFDAALSRFNVYSMRSYTSRTDDLYWSPLIICGDFNYNLKLPEA